MVGGNPELASISQWAQRISSFEFDPVNLYFSYAPVSNLIADPTKRANMARAVQEYLAAGSAGRLNALSVIDGIDNREFMNPQTVMHLNYGPEAVYPNPPSCMGQSYAETGVLNGRSQPICYWPPQVYGVTAKVLAPGQGMDQGANGLDPFCIRDATTGLVEPNTLFCGSGLTPGTKNGCSSCIWSGTGIYGPNYNIAPEYISCCVGVNPVVNKFTAQYGKAGSTISFTCPPI